MESVLGRALTDEDNTPLAGDQDPKYVAERAQQFRLSSITAKMRSADKIAEVSNLHKAQWPDVEAAIDRRDRKLNSMKRGDELAERRAADGQGLYRDQACDRGG